MIKFIVLLVKLVRDVEKSLLLAFFMCESVRRETTTFVSMFNVTKLLLAFFYVYCGGLDFFWTGSGFFSRLGLEKFLTRWSSFFTKSRELITLKV